MNRSVLTCALILLTAPCMAQIMTGSVSGYAGPASQTNNPVSMVFEHKQSQTLADGTHILTVTHEYFYRDSLGRTRNESEFPAFAGRTERPRSVSVQDPVARTFTNWQTGGSDGMVHQFNRTEQAQHQQPLMRSAPSVNQPGVAVQARPPQVSTQPRPKTTTEQLGMQDVQGMPCEASRMTIVYPVDFMGNDRPITTVTEHCRSREFGRVLRESTEDPRNGTRTTTLQSVSRGEPDPSLFQPPPDYIDAKSGAR
jgi:hypothetical protein